MSTKYHTVFNTMMQFNVFILICFVNGACRANTIMYFKISKDEVIPLKNELIIPSKEVAFEILVAKILPAQSHEVVTLDQLTCYNNISNQIIFTNVNFAYVTRYLTTNYTRYMYRNTQELKILRGSDGPWEWLCKLYAHWDGSNVLYEFGVKVKKIEKNETNESTSNDTDEKMPLHEHHVPAKTKQSTKNIKHVDIPTSNEDVGAVKNYHESTEKNIPNKNPDKGEEKQTTEPKSLSSEKTEQTPRDQRGKNQKPTEKNDGMDLDIGMIPFNTSKNVNDSSSQVAYSETSTPTTWVIFVVASVVIFMVGLVIGAICRRPPTTEPVPDPPEQTDDQTEEHIYEEVSFEVVNKGITNRPPLPIPEKAVYIYNSPYDHTRWFQNQSAQI